MQGEFYVDVFEVQCIVNVFSDWYDHAKPNLDTDSQTCAFDKEPQNQGL